jgi:Txe/YoeB family toxin of Txe-Axe toxin-antitoxin module
MSLIAMNKIVAHIDKDTFDIYANFEKIKV